MKHNVIKKIHGQFGRFVSGISIWDVDNWDICCILDGCRADSFRWFYEDSGEYWSVASTSKYWLRRTFEDRDLSSVGYISANPFAADLDPDRFGYFHLEPVADVEEIETVAPSTLRDHAVTAWRRREELGIDRLIIHFMQPHVPFRARPEWFEEVYGTETWGSHLTYRVADGEINHADWVAAYSNNLAWVLGGGVEPLTDLVDATIGITADHGNAFGEWGLWGHPKGVAVPAVRKVPWHTLEGVQVRDDFVCAKLGGRTLTDQETMEQLEALGYR